MTSLHPVDTGLLALEEALSAGTWRRDAVGSRSEGVVSQASVDPREVCGFALMSSQAAVKVRRGQFSLE